MNNAKSNRQGHIDVARAIGIILVAFVHLYFDFTKIYIESFLMPLFFFISGYLFSPQHHKSFTSFFSNRFKRLMYPYFLWSIILFIFWNFLDDKEGSTLSNLKGIIYASGGKEYMEWGIMLWFLPCIFVAEMIYFNVLKYGGRYSTLLVIIIAIIGYYLSSWIIDYLPWSLNVSLVMMLFYHIGQKSKILFANKKFNPLLYILLIPSIALLIISSYLNGDVSTYQGNFGNPILYFLSGIGGLTFILLFSHVLRNFAVLRITGKHTLFIFVSHLRIFTFFKIVQLYIFNIPISSSLTSSIAYTVMAVALLVPISMLINKKFSFLLQMPKSYSKAR
ncbi:acyltransferase family protein [bacterium]|nr:acyltransferase family protein [bacterium]